MDSEGERAQDQAVTCQVAETLAYPFCPHGTLTVIIWTYDRV